MAEQEFDFMLPQYCVNGPPCITSVSPTHGGLFLTLFAKAPWQTCIRKFASYPGAHPPPI